MEDEKGVREVAADWVTRYGHDAVRRLQALAAEAEAADDNLSAEAWRDIATVAAEMIVTWH
jgi:hypothetical protein